jgi:hypothetical protein
MCYQIIAPVAGQALLWNSADFQPASISTKIRQSMIGSGHSYTIVDIGRFALESIGGSRPRLGDANIGEYRSRVAMETRID